MNKVDLQIPIIQQTEDDKTCGPTCMAMIYRFYGKEISRKQILKDLKIEKDETTYTFQLARHFQNSDLKVKGIVSHPDITDFSWRDLSHKELIEKIKEWIPFNIKHRWARSALYYLYFLQEGGTIKITSLNNKIIEKALQNNSLILAPLDESWLWGKRKISGQAKFDDLKGKTTGHFVIICGMDKDKFKIIDPYPTKKEGKEREYWVDKDQVLASILMWSAELLVISEK